MKQKQQPGQNAVDTLEQFMVYASSPWRIMWVSFVSGIFRGLGAVLGASIVIAILIWMLSLFTDMPLVGEYARNIEKTVSEYANDINYEDELERVGETLERIEKALNKEAR